MKRTINYVLEQVIKELDFLSDESIWTDECEKKIVLRATAVAYDAEAFLKTLKEYNELLDRKSSVYMDAKPAFKPLYSSMMMIASRKRIFREDRLEDFKKAVAEFKKAKERLLAAL